MATSPLTSWLPAPPQKHQTRWLRRIYFRITTIVLSTIAIVTYILYLTATENKDNVQFMALLTLGIVITFSFLWSLVNLIAAVVWRYSMPDAAVITLDLIAWTCLATVGGMAIVFVPFSINQCHPLDRKRAALQDCQSIDIAGFLASGAVVLDAIPHFVLFVWGCMDCDGRRIAKKVQKQVRLILEAKKPPVKA